MNARSCIHAVLLLAFTAAMTMAEPHDPPALPQPYAQHVKQLVDEVAKVNVAGPYHPNWESLGRITEAPEWYRDAKFGIYFHWGVYSVPAFGNEWYPRKMHQKKLPEYKHHVETYGDPTKFGYADFVPRFKADKFDADAWAELFKQAGARFAGPVGEHHDGFAMWASKVTPWNAADKGPHRDIAGELEKAIRARGMRFVMSFHHARNNLWFKDGKWTGHYEFVKKDFPSLLNDPQRAILYGYMPREQFVDFWLAKLVEVIDTYHPDLMWFDSWLHEIPEAARQQYLAYYFNRSKQSGQDPVVTFKQKDLPQDVALLDLEKGRMDKLTEFAWLTDDTISRGSWCYTQSLTIKPTSVVLHSLIDIVSKNGCLLLNISPMADGTIPENQRQVLLEIGRWLKLNGEAIYNTRPWKTYGGGPSSDKHEKGHFGGIADPKGGYTPQDVRYTVSKDGKTLYAIALGWPTGPIQLPHVKVVDASGGRVTMIGHDGALKFSVNPMQHLVVTPPDLAESARPCKDAVVFKLVGFSLDESD